MKRHPGDFCTFLLSCLVALMATAPLVAGQDGPADLTRERFDALFDQVNNAGRWGERDERGTLNLVTDAVRREAAREVRDGVSVALGREFVDGPVRDGEPMNLEFMQAPDSMLGPADDSVLWSVERFRLLFHGWAFTHVDALSHMSYRGRVYNAKEARDEGGAPVRNRVGQMRNGILTRGVLVDVPRLRGIPYLEPGHAVTIEDLERWEKHAGVRVRPGDVLLIRTGRWARDAAVEPVEGEAWPGIHPLVAGWLHERGVAALGDEGGKDLRPSVVPGINTPLHALTLVAMGMPLFDNMDLEALAREAAARSRWTFLFIAAPLEIRGGSGSPLNPLAVF